MGLLHTRLVFARRAIETAEITAPACGGKTATPSCEWCELHSPAAGMSWKEIGRRFPARSDRHDPYERRIPGEETWAEMYARVGVALQRLPHDHPGGLVVGVCHGGVIGASFVALGHAPVSAGRLTSRKLRTPRSRSGGGRAATGDSFVSMTARTSPADALMVDVVVRPDHRGKSPPSSEKGPWRPVGRVDGRRCRGIP